MWAISERVAISHSLFSFVSLLVITTRYNSLRLSLTAGSLVTIITKEDYYEDMCKVSGLL